MTRARVVLVLLCFGCADREPTEAPPPKPPPDPLAAELVENLLKPPGGPLSPEEIARTCAACELYKALREGRAVIQENPPVPAPPAPPGR